MVTATDALTTKIPPQSLEAERAVLGALLLEPDAWRRVQARLSADDFYKEGHRTIFAAMVRLVAAGYGVDLVTLSEALRQGGHLDEVGGPAYLSGLLEEAALLARLDDYAGIVLEKARLRDLIRLGTETIARAFENGQPAFEILTRTVGELETLTRRAAPAAPEPELRRAGFDLSLRWPDGVGMELRAIRDGGRDGVRGELTVYHGSRRVSWGAVALANTTARESLRKKLAAAAAGPNWGERLEQAAWHFTEAARAGEPLMTLTGTCTSPTRALLPRLLYEGEPTFVFGDGDTGKSLFALTVAVAVQSGTALPFGLKPLRPVPTAYLDWETHPDTVNERLAVVAERLGIDPPPLLYKRMTRPLVDEAAALAAEFARREIGFVVVDSMMFAVAGGERAAFHEPITAFYGALRLFAPAATLVISHVTGADARGGSPARPYGGAFAFNGPRLIWEARRHPDVDGATAIAFTCRKANNLARRPEPFGLRFQPGESAITIYPLDLSDAPARVVAGASMTYHVRLALARGVEDPKLIVEELRQIGKVANIETVRRLLRRERLRGDAP